MIIFDKTMYHIGQTMSNVKIPFNKPYFTGMELKYIQQAMKQGKISGNGSFTQKCQQFFQDKYRFHKCLLTTSCTDALEMAAILLDIKEGDEVIMPAFTFVSTANAFVLRGASIKFVDSKETHPGMNEDLIEPLISSKTKAIVVVHYAGIACDMNKIMQLAGKYNLFVVEDAAQSIDNYYAYGGGELQALGSIGHLAAVSFHETKNISSGEGGMLIINDPQFVERAEVIWEKGTNRSAFYRGKIQKYEWVDIGSSFLPSEIIAAFLYAQLEQLDRIQEKRKQLWDVYCKQLKPLADKKLLLLPEIPSYSKNNAHMFYIVCRSEQERAKLMNELKQNGIDAVFHYQSLASSKFYSTINGEVQLQNAQNYTSNLLRLPMFYELNRQKIVTICDSILRFYGLAV